MKMSKIVFLTMLISTVRTQTLTEVLDSIFILSKFKSLLENTHQYNHSLLNILEKRSEYKKQSKMHDEITIVKLEKMNVQK